jgi:tetratricopeptide (TPR) repeat protein
MFKRHKLLFAACVCLIFICSWTASASVPYETYLYDRNKNPVRTPSPYTAAALFEGRDIGTTELNNPTDIFVDEKQNIYIADSGNNRILLLTSDFKLVKEINHFSNQEKTDTFSSPQGIFVTESGNLFIADTKHNRIVELDTAGKLVKIIEKPSSNIIRNDFIYEPTRLAVDQNGRIYAIGPGIREGIVEFDSEGKFIRFAGSNKVNPDWIEYFWSRIFATDAQKAQSQLFIPEEYQSIDIDRQGFLYTASILSFLQRINAKGDNILRSFTGMPVQGDYIKSLEDSSDETSAGAESIFVDIAVDQYGTYTGLDNNNKRIFTYDFEGNLLWAFGEPGDQKGAFRQPAAITYMGDNLLVLDKDLGRITVLKLTEYGRQVTKGVIAQKTGENDEATAAWTEVLKLNSSSELAYAGVGKAQMAERRYEEAMASFRLADNRELYSKAFKENRRTEIKHLFPVLATGLVAVLAALILFRLIRGKGRGKSAVLEKSAAPQFPKIKKLSNELHYSRYVIFHPLDGFYELKREHRGSSLSASVILAAVIVWRILSRQATGFIFNTNDPAGLDIIYEIRTILLVMLIWCVANWALTTLMDGEGNLKDIFIMSCYALIPLPLIGFPVILLSNMLTMEEGTFISLLNGIAVAWMLLLFFCGILVTHQYSVKKNIGTIFLSFCGIAVLLFLALVGIELVEWVWNFIETVFKELYLRV